MSSDPSDSLQSTPKEVNETTATGTTSCLESNTSYSNSLAVSMFQHDAISEDQIKMLKRIIADYEREKSSSELSGFKSNSIFGFNSNTLTGLNVESAQFEERCTELIQNAESDALTVGPLSSYCDYDDWIRSLYEMLHQMTPEVFITGNKVSNEANRMPAFRKYVATLITHCIKYADSTQIEDVETQVKIFVRTGTFDKIMEVIADYYAGSNWSYTLALDGLNKIHINTVGVGSTFELKDKITRFQVSAIKHGISQKKVNDDIFRVLFKSNNRMVAKAAEHMLFGERDLETFFYALKMLSEKSHESGKGRKPLNHRRNIKESNKLTKQSASKDKSDRKTSKKSGATKPKVSKVYSTESSDSDTSPDKTGETSSVTLFPIQDVELLDCNVFNHVKESHSTMGSLPTRDIVSCAKTTNKEENITGEDIVMFSLASSITLTSDKLILHDFFKKKGSVSNIGDSKIPVKGEGHILLSTSSDKEALRVKAYYTPSISNSNHSFTSISMRHLPITLMIDQTRSPPVAYLKTAQGNTIWLNASDYRYYISPKCLIPPARYSTKQLIILNVPNFNALSIYDAPKPASFHEKIGHMSYHFITGQIDSCFEVDDATKMPFKDETCTSCIAGKSRQKSFIADFGYAAQGPFDVVHTAIAGPIRIPTGTDAKPDLYYLAIVDEWTHFVKICLLKDKRKETVQTETAKYIAYISNQFGYHVRRLFSDNCSGFINQNIQYQLKSKGMIHITSTARVPASNGFIERYNLTIFNSIRTLLYHAHLPATFWNEAAIFTEQRLNLIFNEKLDMSPFVFLYQYRPKISVIHPFGCLCVWVQPHEYKKNAQPLGHYALYLHSCTGIGSCVYDYESKTIVNTRNVIYMNENKYPGLPDVDQSVQNQYLSPYQCLPLSDIFPDIQVIDPNNDPRASEFSPHRL